MHAADDDREDPSAEDARSPRPAPGRFLALSCLLLVALVAGIYAQSIPYGYVGLDDEHMIQRDQAFLRDLSNLPRTFTRDVFGKRDAASAYYRPLLTISLMLDAQLGGADLRPYRITNVALHALATCLVLAFLLALGARRETALLLALLFAVHPLHVLAVALISGRNDPLLAVFVLGALLALIRYVRSGSRVALALHGLLFAASLFCKESALGLLAVQPLLLAWGLEQDLRSARCRVLAAVWLVGGVAWLSLRGAALPAGFGPAVSVGGLLSNLPTLPQYVGKILFPFNLSIFPTVRDTGFLPGAIAVAVLILAFATSQQVSWRRVGLGAGWFLAFVLPSLTVGALPGFEHRMYLPLVGFAIAALETDWLRRLDPRRPAVAALAGVVIVGFSTISFLRCQTFRDFETFWSHALADSPHSRVAHLIYGAKLMERGRLDDAGAVFTTYLERGGDAQGIHHGLGLVHAARGRTALAQRQFEAELEISPGFADAQLQLGGVYAKSGRGEQAVALWNEILAQDPDFGPAYQALLSYHRSRGDAERAKQVAERMRRRGIREP